MIFGSCFLLRRFLFWLDIIVALLGMQLLLTFRVSRLHTFLRWWSRGKYLSMSFRNSLPMLFLTFPLKGILNQLCRRIKPVIALREF